MTYILVDEYQDLNRAEQAVIDLIRNTASLCVVGDDDQSLYSFKFAHPAGIRTFPDTHPGTTDHEILECRRCPTVIVAIANSLIAHNRDREPNQLSPLAANGPGDIQIRQYPTLVDEATDIARFIRDQIDNHGRRPQGILALAQRRSIGNPIHDALVARDVPSKSYYKEGELDSLTAQERMALFKLFIDQEDRIALRWLLGFGSNDFRAGAYARIRAHCERTGMTPWHVMSQLDAGAIQITYTNHLVDRCRDIRSELAELRGRNGDDDISNLVRRWLPDSIQGLDELRSLVFELAPTADTPVELLTSLNDAIATPEIPPDVTQ